MVFANILVHIDCYYDKVIKNCIGLFQLLLFHHLTYDCNLCSHDLTSQPLTADLFHVHPYAAGTIYMRFQANVRPNKSNSNC